MHCETFQRERRRHAYECRKRCECAFASAVGHTKASDFFSELRDAIRQKNKIRCGRRQLIASIAIASLAPKDGMWPWAEWMDQPTDSNLNKCGRGLMQHNMVRAAVAALLLAAAAAIGGSGAIAALHAAALDALWTRAKANTQR